MAQFSKPYKREMGIQLFFNHAVSKYCTPIRIIINESKFIKNLRYNICRYSTYMHELFIIYDYSSFLMHVSERCLLGLCLTYENSPILMHVSESCLLGLYITYENSPLLMHVSESCLLGLYITYEYSPFLMHVSEN